MQRTWCRLYTGTRNHRKIKLLREAHPNHWTYWYVLIELAGEINHGGWIHVAPGVPFTDKQLSKELGIRCVASLSRLCRTLVALELVTINDGELLVNSFAERNFESDYSTPRVRKYREKLKREILSETVSCNGSETDQNRTEQNIYKPPPPPLKKGGDNYDEDFEAWWKEFPPRRKQGKPVVYLKWKKLKKAKVLPPINQMIETLIRQKKSHDWTKEGGEYCPGPMPYLNQSKFSDESSSPQFKDPIPKYQAPAKSMVTPDNLSKYAEPDCKICNGKGWDLKTRPGGRIKCVCIRSP